MNPSKFFSWKYWQRKYFTLKPWLLGLVGLPAAPETDATRSGPVRTATRLAHSADFAGILRAASGPLAYSTEGVGFEIGVGRPLLRTADRVETPAGGRRSTREATEASVDRSTAAGSKREAE